jgi:hypothetical protein
LRDQQWKDFLMAGDITIQLQGKAGSGLHYAAHLIADSLMAAGATVDTGAALPREELTGTVLRGARVRICLGPDGVPSLTPESARSGLSARIVAAVILGLMVAGAEIKLHFAPGFDLIILFGCIWWFWRFSGRQRLLGGGL